jgi:foldase protein PrsA
VTKRVVVAILVLALIAAVSVAAGCGGGLPKDAVAKVGETYISQEQYDARAASFETLDKYSQQIGIPDKTTDPDGYKEFQRELLDYMVKYELAVQKAPSLKVTAVDVNVSDQEVQTQIDTTLKDSFGGDQAKFDEALAAQDMTLDQLKEYFKASALFEKETTFLQSVSDEVTKDVTTVPDEDIAAYYEANKQTAYFTDETRTVRHILISPKPAGSESTTTTTGSSTTASSTTTTVALTDADWAAAKTTADKVRADLVGGADWTKEAAQYSDDPGSKALGGDLGTVNKGVMVPEFEASVYSLGKDEISQPVKTSYGYHVIQVTGITPAKQSTLDEVKEEITSTLLNQKKYEVWNEWLTKTKAEIGVIYKEGMEPTTTTTAATTATTSGPSTTAGATTSSTASDLTTTTTATGSTTSTAKP